jgi:hypothetical protein
MAKLKIRRLQNKFVYLRKFLLIFSCGKKLFEVNSKMKTELLAATAIEGKPSLLTFP